MKYELINTGYNPEVNINEDTYSIDITLGLRSTNNFIPDFSKIITVVSSNSQTGYEVDIQRENAINDYIAEINK